jgi:hypothetical protein
LAATNMRGAFLNWRFAVNGIQKALRSFGIAALELDTKSSLPLILHWCLFWHLTPELEAQNFDQLEKC